MEPSRGLFGESLRAVIPRGDFEVKATEFSAVVLILNAKVWYGNLVVYNCEVIFVCDSDSLVRQFPIRVDLRQLPVQVLFKLIVEDNATNFAAREPNFIGDFVVQTVEVGIMADFFGFNETVIDRLPVRNPILAGEKLVSFFGEGKNTLRTKLLPFDTVLFEETMAAKILNIILHPRVVACETQLGEVVYGNDAELADLDEGLHLRFTERVLKIAIMVGGAEAVGIFSLKEIWFSTVALCGRASTRDASN